MAIMRNIGGKPKLIRQYWSQPALAAGWNEINLPFEVDPEKTLMLAGGDAYYAWIKRTAAFTPPDGTLIKLNSATQAAIHCHHTYAAGNVWVGLYFLWWSNSVVERGVTTFSSANSAAVPKATDVSLAQSLPSDKVANLEILGFPGSCGAHMRNTAGNIIGCGGWQIEIKDENTFTMHFAQGATAGSIDMPWQVVYWK